MKESNNLKTEQPVKSKKVTFSSEGVLLTGILRSPQSNNQKLPIIIIAPSWINVKEQFAAIYAERLAGLGYHTLTFDFRNYGESGGEIRNYENLKDSYIYISSK